MATADGDPHASVSIVKSTDAAVWDHGSSGDPTRYREMYFVRLHGKFTDCPMCSRPSGVGSFGPARWASFEWDPAQHGSVGGGYGSSPQLEDYGTAYELRIG